ncbi:MAG TPA: DUF3090 domain-containing protein [Mycobacteriales bacterium]|nr:DUF3090 domain-containing protein [Mycobacteriales bacterium]
MARQVHFFDRPDRFIAGTVGEPGDRTFFLQVSGEGRTVSVALEKVQVALLADRLEELLEEVRRQLGGETSESAEKADLDPLESPVDEEFRVGAMGLAWDGDAHLVVIEAQAAGEQPTDEMTILADVEEGPDALRVRITAEEARAFVDRARKVISAGRPPCPLCGQPLDAGGHICPRQNGYRRATLDQ